MSRPTVSLSCILKNEAHNIGPFLQSFKGCFDEIVMVDTGSTDSSIQFIEKINEHIENKNPDWLGFPKIKLLHFEWVDDFSKARQFSMDNCTSDYILWGDLDDCLSDYKAFIKWRDTVMHTAHYWLALYNYAFDQNGKPICQFVRERVVKREFGFRWKYFIHEGLVQMDGIEYWPNKVSSWHINHMRTEEDKKQDENRNVSILSKQDHTTLEPRMLYYYGKELVESGKALEASPHLVNALKSDQLEFHDRILCMQYAAQAAMICKAFPQAIDLAMNGLKLCPERAEYWCLLGDIYLAIGDLKKAIQMFKSAICCVPNAYSGLVVLFEGAYKEHPLRQLTNIYLNMGDFEEAWSYLQEFEKINPNEAKMFREHYFRGKELSVIKHGLPKVDDIIITCPPGAMITDWDEKTLKEKGLGGSETACVEVAKWLKAKTKRNVKVYNVREKTDVMESGVEYIPVAQLSGYLHNVEPYFHVSWRHSIKLTQARSMIWCHDLITPGADRLDQYDKIMCLSEFHQDYLYEMLGVPKGKTFLTYNGIDPKLYEDTKMYVKDPNKIIFPSSPDRGLDRTIEIVKRMREKSDLPLELHVFYGFDNLRKGGLSALADKLEKLIADNPWVKYHGNVSKFELARHMKEAVLWLYPANFIETYCITAIEALCSGVFPIVREMGALVNTLGDAKEKGMCKILDRNAVSDEEYEYWSEEGLKVIREKAWERVVVDPQDYSWERVADQWIKEFNL